jgi:hypothetical protein
MDCSGISGLSFGLARSPAFHYTNELGRQRRFNFGYLKVAMWWLPSIVAGAFHE